MMVYVDDDDAANNVVIIVKFYHFMQKKRKKRWHSLPRFATRKRRSGRFWVDILMKLFNEIF